MTKSSPATLRLLGAFTVEVTGARSATIVVRSRKARALLAYLAMKPDGRAGREELATLLWGDNPDAQARHSLRQCLVSLRQDLNGVGAELLDIGRETIELRSGGLVVDARELQSLAASAESASLGRAAALWRGAFLADLALDIEEFDGWRQREQDRLAETTARVFERLATVADAARDGERALAAAEQLVALDPTREDRQRVALKLIARYRGRDAALDRAKIVTSQLRSELDVEPEAATRALIEEIKRGTVAPALPQPEEPAQPAITRPAPAADQVAPAATAAAQVAADTSRPPRRPWYRQPIAAGFAVMLAGAVGVASVFAIASGPAESPVKVVKTNTAKSALASAVVLPFTADGDRNAPDQEFARQLTRDLTAALARYDLRMIADRTAELYGDRQADVARIGAELDVPYAIIGRVRRAEGQLRTEVQLIDTATRVTLWSDQMQRETSEPARLAGEVAQGFSRMLLMNIVYAETRRLKTEPGQPVPVNALLLRARAAELHSYVRENVVTALRLHEEALRRAPNNLNAMLGVARTNVLAEMNFVDIEPAPDLARAEKLLNEVLRRAPNWLSAHFTLAMLQKRQRQFDASLQSLQRCLELNPGFLPARGQMASVLTRMGQPQKGLEIVQDTIRQMTPNDPGLGFLYLFAADAELELGHDAAALNWARRAETMMPGSALAHAWLASVYTAMGDQPNAAKYTAALRAMAPGGVQRFLDRRPPQTAANWPRSRRIHELRVALAAPQG